MKGVSRVWVDVFKPVIAMYIDDVIRCELKLKRLNSDLPKQYLLYTLLLQNLTDFQDPRKRRKKSARQTSKPGHITGLFHQIHTQGPMCKIEVLIL